MHFTACKLYLKRDCTEIPDSSYCARVSVQREVSPSQPPTFSSETRLLRTHCRQQPRPQNTQCHLRGLRRYTNGIKTICGNVGENDLSGQRVKQEVWGWIFQQKQRLRGVQCGLPENSFSPGPVTMPSAIFYLCLLYFYFCHFILAAHATPLPLVHPSFYPPPLHIPGEHFSKATSKA